MWVEGWTKGWSEALERHWGANFTIIWALQLSQSSYLDGYLTLLRSMTSCMAWRVVGEKFWTMSMALMLACWFSLDDQRLRVGQRTMILGLWTDLVPLQAGYKDPKRQIYWLKAGLMA